MEKSLTLWCCANASGQHLVFLEKPKRDERFCTWLGTLLPSFQIIVGYFIANGLDIPDLTWLDEPVEIELRINVKQTK